MKLHFFSISETNKVNFISDYEIQNESIYVFDDKSLENTKLCIDVKSNEEILFERYGDTNMNVRFIPGVKTKGEYSNSMGLEFGFHVHTKNIEILDKKITVEYDLYIDGEYNDSIKIYMLLK